MDGKMLRLGIQGSRILLYTTEFCGKIQRFPFVLRLSKDENGNHWFLVRQACPESAEVAHHERPTCLFL